MIQLVMRFLLFLLALSVFAPPKTKIDNVRMLTEKTTMGLTKAQWDQLEIDMIAGLEKKPILTPKYILEGQMIYRAFRQLCSKPINPSDKESLKIVLGCIDNLLEASSVVMNSELGKYDDMKSGWHDKIKLRTVTKTYSDVYQNKMQILYKNLYDLGIIKDGIYIVSDRFLIIKKVGDFICVSFNALSLNRLGYLLFADTDPILILDRFCFFLIHMTQFPKYSKYGDINKCAGLASDYECDAKIIEESGWVINKVIHEATQEPYYIKTLYNGSRALMPYSKDSGNDKFDLIQKICCEDQALIFAQSCGDQSAGFIPFPQESECGLYLLEFVIPLIEDIKREEELKILNAAQKAKENRIIEEIKDELLSEEPTLEKPTLEKISPNIESKVEENILEKPSVPMGSKAMRDEIKAKAKEARAFLSEITGFTNKSNNDWLAWKEKLEAQVKKEQDAASARIADGTYYSNKPKTHFKPKPVINNAVVSTGAVASSVEEHLPEIGRVVKHRDLVNMLKENFAIDFDRDSRVRGSHFNFQGPNGTVTMKGRDEYSSHLVKEIMKDFANIYGMANTKRK